MCHNDAAEKKHEVRVLKERIRTLNRAMSFSFSRSGNMIKDGFPQYIKDLLSRKKRMSQKGLGKNTRLDRGKYCVSSITLTDKERRIDLTSKENGYGEY